MHTFITLIRYTDRGIAGIKDAPARADEMRQACRSVGAELKDFYMCLGQYDALVIAEGPDDNTAAKLAVVLGGGGTGRTETMRAFTEDEFRSIVDNLP